MKNPGPEVSIILPTFNREVQLSKTVDSILKQTYRDFELIVLDDGSTDCTNELIANFNDPRIRYQKLKHTGHISALRNEGMRASRGKFIAPMDSDDLWLPRKLEEQIRVLQNYPSIGFTITDVTILQDGDIIRSNAYKKFMLRYRNKTANLFKDLFESNLKIFTPAILFRKTCLEKTGMMNESFDGGDFEFFARLLFHFEGIMTPDPLVLVNRHKSNLSLKKGNERIDEIFYSLQLFYSQGHFTAAQYKRFKLRFLYLKSRDLTMRKKFSDANTLLKKCIIKNPLSLKYYFCYLQNCFKLITGDLTFSLQ